VIASWIWTLSIDWHGGPYLLSSADLPGYETVLAPVAFEERLDVLPDAPSDQQVSVRFDLGDRLRVLLASGCDPRTMTGVLRLVPVDAEGEVLDGSRLVALGPLRGLVWGSVEAPGVVEASIGVGEQEETPLLSPSAVISAELWPTAPEQAHGVAYPLVFGRPGDVVVDDNRRRAGSPATVITTSGGGNPILALVAGHPVDAADVELYNATTDTWTSGVDVATTADLAREWREALADSGLDYAVAEQFQIGVEGRYGAELDGALGGLSVIDVTGLAAVEDELFVAWTSGRALSGVATAGDLLRYLLRRSGWAVDAGRTEAVCRALGHDVAGYVDDPGVSVQSYLQDVVLPLLPVALARGPAGVYPVLLAPEALDGAPTFALVEGEDCEAIGAVGAEDLVGPRAVRVSFGWDASRERYEGQAATGTLPGAQYGRSTTLGSRQLATRGSGPVEDIEGIILRDVQTAQQVGVEQHRLRNFSPLQRSYACPADRILELGDVGRVTDAAVGWSSRPVLVIGREWDGARWLYRLAAWSVP